MKPSAQKITGQLWFMVSPSRCRSCLNKFFVFVRCATCCLPFVTLLFSLYNFTFLVYSSFSKLSCAQTCSQFFEPALLIISLQAASLFPAKQLWNFNGVTRTSTYDTGHGMVLVEASLILGKYCQANKPRCKLERKPGSIVNKLVKTCPFDITHAILIMPQVDLKKCPLIFRSQRFRCWSGTKYSSLPSKVQIDF
jgi:hypothetical protein